MGAKEKILLINPPLRMFPVGMAYVLASLENHGIDFDFADAQFGDDYKKLIRKNDYCAVATGGLISQFKFFNEVSRMVREISPDTPLILGGGVTKDMSPGLLFDKLNMAYGIVGEAETSFPFLVDALMNKKSGFEAIPGLLYKDRHTGEIRTNPVRRLDLSTSDILPAWHRFNVDYYINNWEHVRYGHRLCMPVISARGCTGACTICSNLLGAFHKRPIDQVIREIGLLDEKYTFDWLAFYNEMFYSTREDIVNFCDAFKSTTLKKKWMCDLRVDVDLDIDTFRLMKDAGCVAVFGGLESGSDNVLSRMRKRTTREMLIRFFRTAEAAGLPCEGTFLVGNEGEAEVDLKETIDMVTGENMRAMEHLICTYPGTKIYKNAKKRGLIGDEWEYLQHLDFLADIWDYSWSKKYYVNISDIPDDRFWETVVGELRRFNTCNLTQCVPRDMTCSQKFGMLTKVNGVCAHCGSAVTFVTPRKMLGIRTFCRDCFRTVEFNPYELPEFGDHFRRLCIELRKAERLAIIGTKAEASFMLQYDYFGLNYNSLIAFVEIDKKASGIPDFCHLPRIRLHALPAMNPDTLLIVDDQFGSAELKIRSFYLKKNLRPPRILHLLPDDKRPFGSLVAFIRKHDAATLLNKCIVVPLIKIPILVAETKAWLLTVLKSNYEVLNRNALFRKLLERVRR